jgi:hypothetical protein
MKPIALTRVLVCSTLTLFSAFAYSDTSDSNLPRQGMQAKLIAEYFGFELPVEIYLGQSDALNADWFSIFRVLSDLTDESLITFIVKHPNQLVPVRNYLQQLVNEGVIDSSRVLKVLEKSVDLLSQNNEALETFDTNHEMSPLPTSSESVLDARADQTELVDEHEPVKSSETSRLFGVFDNAKISLERGDDQSRFESSYLTAFDGEGEIPEFFYLQLDLKIEESSSFGDTVGLGGGYRTVMPGNKLMFGVNVFHDWDLNHGHRRGSVGFTAESSQIKISGNRYFGLTGYQVVSSSIERKAIDAEDIGVQVAFPYVPGTYLTYEKFRVITEQSEDIKGYELGIRSHLSDRVSLEMFERDFQARRFSDQFRIKLNFHWLPSGVAATVSDALWTSLDLGSDRYAIVDRDPLVLQSR